MSALLKELKDKTAEINQIKSNLVKELQPKFKDLFMPLFDKYSDLIGVRWTQYTPYFNDGEECIFSVGDLCIKHNFVDGDYEEEDEAGNTLPLKWTDGSPSTWIYDKSGRHYNDSDYVLRRENNTKNFGSEEAFLAFVQDLRDVSKSIQDIPDDVMQDLFGNHVKITVDRNGLTVDEYDHD